MSRSYAIDRIKLAKFVAPEMFVNKTPRLHLDLIEHISSPDPKVGAVLFRGAGKTTVVNKIDGFASVYFDHEPYQQIFSSTSTKAKKFLKDIKTMVINGMLKGLDIQKGDIWNDTEVEIIVNASIDGIGKKCFIEALGAGQDPRGGSFNFARPTKQTFDDIESKIGLYAIGSKKNRDKLDDWFEGDCLPSLDPIYGRARFIGTILHEDSKAMRLLKDPQWNFIRKPIIENGKSAWNDRFPLTKELAEKKEQEIFSELGIEVQIESVSQIKDSFYSKGKHNLFYQEYLCLPQSEERKLFKSEDFRYFSHIEYSDEVKSVVFKNAKQSEKILAKVPLNIILNDGSKIPLKNCFIYSAMDLASDGQDKSSIITVAYDSNRNWYLLDISCGTWTPFDKSVNAIRVQMQFSPIRFGIEKASAQNDFFYTIDVAQKETGIRIPVEELRHGGVNKNIRISNLQPVLFTNKIYFNSKDQNTPELEAQLSSFDIEVESTADDLMDTLAYHLHFVKGRSFTHVHEDEEDDDYDYGPTWG
ncbi:MAG: hypothetical protein M0Q25_08270 [Sulfurospirillaceae bacterium]|nr:hypothetical protein [Sulfurospirillaceae bacterium]